MGILNQEIENVGIDWATDFIRTSFPIIESKKLHPSFNSLHLNAPLRDNPTSEGIPRYFSFTISFGTSRMLNLYGVPLGLQSTFAEKH
jgi:hypothetical protein